MGLIDLSSVPPVIADSASLTQVIDRLKSVPTFALDTEFHRERTYWPQLALLQVAWPQGSMGDSGVVLIDPLAVEASALAEVFQGSGVMVAHAAEQDLEVLQLACGVTPSTLFDTQVAAAFLGCGIASLGALTERFCGVSLAKGDRLTDWSRRPLSSSQILYAASDVAHLLELADILSEQLRSKGRLQWVEEECALLLAKDRGPGDLRRAWWKMRDCRQLRGQARGVAQEVAAWRETQARETDTPARLVLPDLALAAIVHSQPTSEQALAQTRGLDARHIRGGSSEGILQAVSRGMKLKSADIVLPPSDEASRELRPAVALAAAWIAQLAKDEGIDASLLATRADIVSYLRGDESSRLASGWRADLVGIPIGRLVRGQASLAFDGAGRLVMEPRHWPMDSSDQS